MNLAWYVDSMALARHGAGIDAMRGFCPTWTDEQLRLRAGMAAQLRRARGAGKL